MATAIEVDDLRKRYDGGVVAVDGVGFAVERGQIFGYLGRNGSGKTTTVRVLTTLSRPTSGTATVAGLDVVEEAAEVRRRIGVTMQDAALDPQMTAREHVRFVAGALGHRRSAARERADELLEVFGLLDAADRRIATYSGGMARRLDVATALLGEPEVLFLDEPTTGLDPQSRRALWGEIRRLRDAGTAVFLTTQYLEEADELADLVAIIDEGRLVATGTASDLKRRHGRRRIGFDADGIEVSSFRRLPGTVRRDGQRVVIDLDATVDDGVVVDVLNRVRDVVAPRHLIVTTASLEDVFLTLTGSGLESGAAQAAVAP